MEIGLERVPSRVVPKGEAGLVLNIFLSSVLRKEGDKLKEVITSKVRRLSSSIWSALMDTASYVVLKRIYSLGDNSSGILY